MATNHKPFGITNNETRHRFEAHVDGQTAVLEYTLVTGLIVYNHTEVPKNLEGQGIATQLARTALAPKVTISRSCRCVPMWPLTSGGIRNTRRCSVPDSTGSP